MYRIRYPTRAAPPDEAKRRLTFSPTAATPHFVRVADHALSACSHSTTTAVAVAAAASSSSSFSSLTLITTPGS